MILCPSMMCADYARLKQEVQELEAAGADIFHCDVMDGCFVPNITMGLMDVKTVRAHTKAMVDVHLMIEHPADKVDWFLQAGVDLIYIHPEAEPQVMKTLMYIRAQGKLAGLAINPDTSVSTIKELLPHCDYILIMSVFPGFAGQSFIQSIDAKIRELISRKQEYGYRIVLDGACSAEVIQRYHALGVDGFVLGTSALFQGEGSYADNMKRLRSLQ